MKNTFSDIAFAYRKDGCDFLELLGMLDELCREAQSSEALKSGKRIAILGSGPAGLGAAAVLCGRGHAVEVFEAAPAAGFTLLHMPSQESSSPAPNAVTPVSEEVLKAALATLTAAGITFRTSCPLGQSELPSLLDRFDAVICACGKAAVFVADENGRVREKLYAAGTCVKNQKVLDALAAMRSGLRLGGAVDALLS